MREGKPNVKNKVSAMIREAAAKNPNEWVNTDDLRIGDILVHPQPDFDNMEYGDDYFLGLDKTGEWDTHYEGLSSSPLRDYSNCVREVRVVGITLMDVGHRIVTEYGSEQDWEGQAIRVEVEPLVEWDDVAGEEISEEGDDENGFYWDVVPRYQGDEWGKFLRVRGGRHL